MHPTRSIVGGRAGRRHDDVEVTVQNDRETLLRDLESMRKVGVGEGLGFRVQDSGFRV
jgi:hypothetical protein